MTREEANWYIDSLKLTIKQNCLDEKYIEAIETLKAEPSDKEEIIRDIPGYEGLYKIDIFGNIYNKKGRILKQRENEFGYFDIGLNKNNREKRHKVHRLVAQTFIPNPQNKTQVNHIDGNKKNNIVWNLEWVTPKENTQHSIATQLRRDEPRNLLGQRFGRLVVTEYVGDTRTSQGKLRHLWKCQCDCGNTVISIDNTLIVGHRTTCGCRRGIRKCKQKIKEAI